MTRRYYIISYSLKTDKGTCKEEEVWTSEAGANKRFEELLKRFPGLEEKIFCWFHRSAYEEKDNLFRAVHLKIKIPNFRSI